MLARRLKKSINGLKNINPLVIHPLDGLNIRTAIKFQIILISATQLLCCLKIAENKGKINVDLHADSQLNSTSEHKSEAGQADLSLVKNKRGFLRFPRSWAEVKKSGWKFVLGFILFYLIRDTILYILLPYLIVKGIISF